MNYIIRRGFTLTVTLLLVSIITFALFQIVPGDPALVILGIDAEQEQIDALRAKFQMDLPVYERYLNWIVGVLKGDAGESIRFSTPVIDLIKSRLPVTISLAVLSIGMAIIIAIPMGILAARNQGKWSGFLISVFTQLGMAIPSFWLGIMLILVFGLKLSWFAPGGYVPWNESITGALRSLFLPAVANAILVIAVIVRYLRTTVIEQLKLDYVRTAYSKGLEKKYVVYKHVLKNALIPVITVLGMLIASVLGGSLVIEQVFSLPGLGRLLVSSISYRDFLLVQGVVMYIAIAVILINFIVDILYKVIDPRIKLR